MFSLEIHLGNTSGHPRPSAHLVRVIVQSLDRGDPLGSGVRRSNGAEPRAQPSITAIRTTTARLVMERQPTEVR